MARFKSSSRLFLAFLVLTSALSIVSLPLLLETGKFQADFSFAKMLIGSFYSGICILGIAAVFFPKKCQNTFTFGKKGKGETYSNNGKFSVKTQFVGHHPQCEKFSANRIGFGKYVLCSSCAGLLVGAIIALFGTLLYFFAGAISLSADPKVLWSGIAGMLLGLIQFKFGGYTKLVVNALFVVSSFIILAETDSIRGDLLINFYTLCIIVFLLLTRIALSEWNNKKICAKCEDCELSV